ncbi:hypothetical protein [Streptomyces sp. A012304]|uniref:hypothetical protein n=1 Tax=Streptomyces sp. A012304 TaxID=375446 RepID=UPI002232084F|nr:hypothetical protein [Streptomyces sp. A012304]GKQ40456.1 hypothetical protein ALMP_69820 [Streptomyces sp. A012304]
MWLVTRFEDVREGLRDSTPLDRHPDMCLAEGPESPRRIVVPGTPPRLPRPAVRV